MGKSNETKDIERNNWKTNKNIQSKGSQIQRWQIRVFGCSIRVFDCSILFDCSAVRLRATVCSPLFGLCSTLFTFDSVHVRISNGVRLCSTVRVNGIRLRFVRLFDCSASMAGCFLRKTGLKVELSKKSF